MIGVDDILAAMAAWEQAEFVTAAVPRAGNFRSFKYFPEQADVKVTDDYEGLQYPYSCHDVDSSDGAMVSLGETPTAEDEQTHVVWVSIVFGQEGDSLAKRAENNSKWRDAYRAAFLKHLSQGISASDAAGIVSSTMGTIRQTAFDLFDRPEVGIAVPITVCVRQTMPAATGTP